MNDSAYMLWVHLPVITNKNRLTVYVQMAFGRDFVERAEGDGLFPMYPPGSGRRVAYS